MSEGAHPRHCTIPGGNSRAVVNPPLVRTRLLSHRSDFDGSTPPVSYEHSAYYCAKRLSYYSQRAYPLVLSFGYTTYTVLLFKRPNSPVQPKGVPSYLSGHSSPNQPVRPRAPLPDTRSNCVRPVHALLEGGSSLRFSWSHHTNRGPSTVGERL